ncbi:hypothetical protein FB451DRAFT_1535137 [Mycena latifolia]|nr:hypothetical protein FB451DRAFT_1535137 [Mycena latifolia]
MHNHRDRVAYISTSFLSSHPGRETYGLWLYEYGEHSYDAATFDHQDFYDTDPRCYDPGYDVAPVEYYEPCGEEYAYEEAHPIDSEVFNSHNPNCEEGGDAGCMEIAYGEPGYWEEYHRRRYEILYGSDVGEEVESPKTSESDGELALLAVSVGPYDEHNLSEEHVEDATEFHGVEEDAALAWQLRRRLVDENELAWAEAMEVWRRRLESDEHSSEESACGPEYVEESPDAVHEPPSFELQASYDRREIPESDREGVVRVSRG